METKNYNGWTNYETWNVKLWMDNDSSTADYWSEQAKLAFKDAEPSQYFTKEQESVNILREQVKDEFEQGMPDLGCSTYADLLNASMSEVNWHEIAKALIEDNCNENEGIVGL